LYRNRRSTGVPAGLFVLLSLLPFAGGCDRESAGPDAAPAAAECPPGNGGLSLPPGFCAEVVADNLGFVRHLAVSPDGRLFATLRNLRLGLGGLILLEDADRDGRMEGIRRISDEPGMGIGVHGDFLYFATETRILRYPLAAQRGVDAAAMQVVVDGFPEQERHSGKPLAIDRRGNLYVNVGASGNACQQQEGVAGSPGLDPCPELERQAGIWRFAADRTGQDFTRDGVRHAGGIRNAYALDWHPRLDALLLVQHGRDHLHDLWPERFTLNDSAMLPSEEMILVRPGAVYGWPYCFHDPRRDRLLLAPEYGGDGSEEGRCAEFPPPLYGFPAHYGPNDLVVYTADLFPDHYRDGAFIAFHGSYDRGPYEQVGFQVVFVPFRDGALQPAEWEVFADGFAGAGPIPRPEDAEYRPTGLAIGPDGTLYVSDSVQGRIWRIRYYK
jgi:glucose/arabinose dehydrogenase